MLNLFWLLSVLAQSAMLVTYLHRGLARTFPWWCWSLGLRIVGSGILYSVGREANPYLYYKVLVALELPMLALIAFAVIEATQEARSPHTRPSWGMSAGVSGCFIGWHAFTDRMSLMGALRSVIESVAAVLLIFLSAAMLQLRKIRRLDYPVKPHILLVLVMLWLELARRLVVSLNCISQNDMSLYAMAASALLYGAGTVVVLRSRPRSTT